ncbi:hypothetical protein C8Q75DRAFT_68134 [Abortiporus biennis]|nr:hypothetical protein C8Q75DRAFT_68134 [Abortiporus biennis]
MRFTTEFVFKRGYFIPKAMAIVVILTVFPLGTSLKHNSRTSRLRTWAVTSNLLLHVSLSHLRISRSFMTFVNDSPINVTHVMYCCNLIYHTL